MSADDPETAAPDVEIRARPPSPRRLSRKVLLAGAGLFAAIVTAALFIGLGERPSRASSRAEENVASAAGPPETIRLAPANYDLRVPADHEASGMEENDELIAPRESAFVSDERAAAPASRTSSPDPDEAARVSPIFFTGAREGTAGRERAQGGRLEARLAPPRSPHEILAGSVIPAALATELNSDLPGRVIAQVTAPVFDTVSGEHLLIPQGSRLIGAYDGSIAHGEERLSIVWQRLILPNGFSIDLSNMEGADPSGAAGLRDRVDNHLGRLATAVLLSSIMSVAANEAEDDEESDGFGRSVGDAAAQEAARSGARIVERDLQIAPTIRVRAGAPVRVLVMRDIALRPYRS